MDKFFLIDNHTHGAYGINFNYAQYNDIKYLLSELFKRGIMGICPTLVGEDDEKIYNQLKLFKRIKEEQFNSPQKETFIIGAHLEGSFLSPKRPGIQDVTTFKKPNIENFKNLVKDCAAIVKIVTIAPEEDEGLINYLNSVDIIAQAGHTTGDNIKNCIGTTHHFNTMPSIHHRNSSIALQGLLRDDIYIEVIADLIHLSSDILKLIFKVKPKEKIILISDSLPCAHSNGDIIFCSKKINSLGLDDNNTLAGSNKTLDEICFNLVKNNILTFDEIEQMAFYNVIKYLKLNNDEITRLNYFK
ncbi:MAG: hypothetical protein IJ877_04520 [Candidatus Gastranaerophilales bacterium]|nr:hypothetical protein [Candidatus Gastranaerophilales bacterium]